MRIRAATKSIFSSSVISIVVSFSKSISLYFGLLFLKMYCYIVLFESIVDNARVLVYTYYISLREELIMKKTLTFLLVLSFVFLCACGSDLGMSEEAAEEIYQNAMTCIENGEYEEAYLQLLKIQTYKDVYDQLDKFVVLPKFVTTTSYYSDPPSTSSLQKEFDEMGNAISITSSNDSSDINKSTYEYKYDTNGKCVQAGDTTYEYDQNGNLVKSVQGEYVTTYSYDENGYLIKAVSGAVTRTYEYDKNGNRAKETHVNSNNGATREAEYSYDKYGRLSEYVETYSEPFSDGATKITLTFEYDNRGFLTSRTIKRNVFGSEVIKNIYGYDEDGFLRIRIRTDKKGKEKYEEIQYDGYEVFYEPTGYIEGANELIY